MRLISRAVSKTPGILLGEAAWQWRQELTEFFTMSHDRRGRSRAPTAKHLYGDRSVLHTLEALQRNKCAYCETSLHGGAAIDHFRPLSNAVSQKERIGSPDHYAWFAIEWRNLMLVCHHCNAAKRNLFPIRGDRCLPLSPWDDASKERPLIINPFTIRAERHLVFKISGKVEAHSEAGDTTIGLLRLNRDELVRDRRQAIRAAHRYFRSRSFDRDELRQLLWPASAFSGVIANHLYWRMTDEGAPMPPGRDLAWQLSRVMGLNGRTRRRSRPPNHGFDSVASTSSASQSEPTSPAVRDLSINTIDIRNFKGISNITLKIPSHRGSETTPCLMLLGENATGKSSVLQAVALCLMRDQEREALSLSRQDFLSREARNWDSPLGSSPSVRLNLEGEATCRWEWSTDGGPRRNATTPPHVWAYGAHRRVGQAPNSQRAIASLFNPDIALPDPAKWLSSIDDHLFNAVARALRIVLALRKGDDIFRDLAGRVMVKAHGRQTPLDQLSDGYRSLMAMIADIMMNIFQTRGDLEYARGVVLIDEIEVHLHPRWKMRVVSALREALPGIQFVFTTHDPLCLRGMEKDEVAVIYRDARGEVKALTELPDVSTLRVDQLLTSDLFGLNSSTDPRMDRITDELASLAAIPIEQLSHDQHARRDVLLAAFPGMEVIGSDVGRQIAAEALTRHLAEQDQGDLVLRADARKESVQKLLRLLDDEA